MKLYHYPKIAPGEYDAFRRLILDLPENYEVWLKRLNSKMQRDEQEDGSSVGHHFVEVIPTDFIAWCKKTGSDRSLNSLYNYATDKPDRLAAERGLGFGTPQSLAAQQKISGPQAARKKRASHSAKRRTARATTR